MLHEFCLWLASTSWSIQLHESLYLYPLLESTHVLSITIFVGTLAFIDLRMLGVSFGQVAISHMLQKVLPWTLLGFAILIITGVLLFYAIPVRTFHSIFFRIKLVLLVLAAINAFLYHRRMSKEGEVWDKAVKPPLWIRLSAVCSLTAWAGVIVMGRMIAYNWFDCDRQPQSEFINWAASCAFEMGV